MRSHLYTVGIGTSLLFTVLLGVYVISEQNNHMSMMGILNYDKSTKAIHMGMNMFMPTELHIEPNTTISWQTHDMKIHNVYGIFKTDSGNEISILSGDIEPMETWSYTFEESGVFEYTCGYHESKGMKGRLVVS